MVKITVKIISGLIFAYCVFLLAFAYEENYRKLIRYLFKVLTQNKISFYEGIKYVHFASGKFMAAFCLFIFLLVFFLFRQSTIQRIIILFLTVLIFSTSIFTFCYLISLKKLVECTACPYGKRTLFYDEINYDLIFIWSLVFAIIPALFVGYINQRKLTSL